MQNTLLFAGLHFAKPVWHSTLGGETILWKYEYIIREAYVFICIVLILQLAKLHQLSMQQSLSPIAQPASTVLPGM